ncbi:hypothetical protein Ocin01_03065 [Orchesella cincta]|uniref:Uncharacterized protein n=1 Tax=Orchesella cincta TaxID=48709 RepID=A0A1D2NEB9_ORCCI|nr:hypothetical protein Ocin01_03065 [Orchesella cincta]
MKESKLKVENVEDHANTIVKSLRRVEKKTSTRTVKQTGKRQKGMRIQAYYVSAISSWHFSRLTNTVVGNEEGPRRLTKLVYENC